MQNSTNSFYSGKTMKRRVFVLLCIFSLYPCICTLGETNTITIIEEKKVTFDFKRYGLVPKVFEAKDITNLSDQKERELEESIKDSYLLFFGEQVPSTAYGYLFSSERIRNAIKGLLKRGGCIYFGPTSWSIISSLPEDMKLFFREINAHILTVENYKREKPDHYFTGIANPDFPHPFTSSPNDLSKTDLKWQGEKAIRYFDNLPTVCKALLIDKEKRVPLAVIQEGILGNGKIIYSYCYTSTRQRVNPFIENIVINLYTKGKDPKDSGISNDTKRKLERSIYPVYTEKAPKIDGKRDAIWEDAFWIELIDAKSGLPPKKKTKVACLYNRNSLYFFFDMEEPHISKLKANVLERDGEVWKDDCAEILLKVGKNTYHFIINSKGITYDDKNQNYYWNPDYKTAVNLKENSWQVEIELPFALFGPKAKEEKIWQIGLFREEKQLGELSSILPTPHGFLDPACWSYLIFCSKEEAAYILKDQANKTRKTLNRAGYFLWYENPYTEKYYEDLLPKDDQEELKSLKVTVLQNEKECTDILITNFTDTPLIFRIEKGNIKPKKKGDKELSFDDIITIKQAIPRLNSYKQERFDPLIRLNEANIIVIPPLKTEFLWLEIKTDAPAGEYLSSIEFVPVNSLLEAKKVEIKVEVLPIRLPDKLPIIGYNFGPYDFLWAKGKRENYFKICPEYHITLGHLYFPLKAIKKDKNGKIYISKDKEDYFRKVFSQKENKYIIEEKLAEQYFEGWIYSYGIFNEFNVRLAKLGIPAKKMHNYTITTMDKKEWDNLFTEWVSRWFEYLKEEKIDFKRFYIPLCDEPKDEIIPELIKIGKLIKSINPEVQLTIDPASWSTFEVFKKLEPIIDLWIPWEVRLTLISNKDKGKEIQFYKKTGKPFVPYTCSISTQTLPILSYYRLRGIREYLLGANGIALWSFNSWENNDWNEFDGKKGDCMIFYHSDKGPIPSIRAEAFREAFEDFYLLILADDIFKKTKNRKLGKLIEESYLRGLMGKVDADMLLKWREELIHTIADANK